MRIWSDSWRDGDAIPSRYAAGRLDTPTGVTFSDNVSPHLAWDDVPEGTQSFAIIMHDIDVPTRGDDVNKADREVPADLLRGDFFHWVLIDLPPSLRSLSEGEFSSAFTARGKSGPGTLHGARHGLNDYTGWFAGDAALAGDYFGYDGPWPPFNDARVHRYVTSVFAVSVPRLPLDGRVTGHEVRAALQGRVLSEASWLGTYTLNRRVLGGQA